jgi:hypothetical protein
MTENELAKIVVDVAYQIHRKLGPGLFESVYQAVLIHELRKRRTHQERHQSSRQWVEGIRRLTQRRQDAKEDGLLCVLAPLREILISSRIPIRKAWFIGWRRPTLSPLPTTPG